MDAVTIRNLSAVAVISAILAFLSIVTAALLALRQAKLLKRYRLILNGDTGRDLEALLLANGEEIENLNVRLAEIARQQGRIEENNKLHVQKTATVRFNAFPDTGSDLSFAIALLDANNNGLILSSLYGRSESRVYAKPVQNGTSTYTLSDEEKAALTQAIASARGNRDH